MELTCRPELEKSELINATETAVTPKSQADKFSDLLYGSSFSGHYCDLSFPDIQATSGWAFLVIFNLKTSFFKGVGHFLYRT
jgi:hypothetical protein